MDLSEIINILGEDRENYYNAVAPPVMQTSNFTFRNTDEMHQKLINEVDEVLYTRGNNPTIDILRKKLAALEKTEDALVLASGSGAIAAAVISNVKGGDHVVCVQSPYSWTDNLLNVLLSQFGVSTTMVDGTKTQNFVDAIRPETSLIYLESPNTFLFEIQDLAAVGQLAKEHGILTIIDNSCASPVFQNPADFGIDIIVHSATKYIGGHSDTVAGVICGTKEMIQKIHVSGLMTLGAAISPWNAWLLLRSLRTLPMRMDRISESTAKVIEFLEERPEIEKIYYPFSKNNPQYELACRQMKKGAGLFAVSLKVKSVKQVSDFCESLKRFLLAVSWGGHESLVLPIFTTFKSLENIESNPNYKLVRFYIGLEDPEILIEDIKQGLAAYSL
jgi:cystathionine beta-lyase/cystathionine gamma-synthase